MNYQEVLDFLYTQLPMYQRVGKSAFKKDLGNTLLLSERLKDPHTTFKSIHIAGTNGKGSTSHLIASILQAAGYKVGLYTSPHLKSFRERIRINGHQVSEQFIANFVNANKNNILDISPSFFEITVVMAFDYFAQENVDFAVIETGLGGRLDSTNIINPELSVITSISLDHEDMLGNTLEAIAREKAGIIKENTPVVIGKVPNVALQMIEKVAKPLNAHVIKSKPLLDHHYVSDLPKVVLDLNIHTVLSSCDVLNDLGFEISERAIFDGISNVVSTTGLKGRWQMLNNKPLVIADVGHNEEAVLWIMSELKKITYQKLYIVWGVVADKSIDKIFPLMISDCNYYFCAADVPRAMSAVELQGKAEQFGLKGTAFNSVDDAYTCALESANDEDLVFVGGSTFVVAEIKDL